MDPAPTFLVPVVRLDRVESTSRLARHWRTAEPPAGPRPPYAIVASEQTAGVGRFGRGWASPRGGLWFTLVWPLPPNPEAVLRGLGLRVGLACARAVQEAVRSVAPTAEPHVRLKWPNDVLFRGRKVLGVLTEVIRREPSTELLVGVGINANTAPEDLPPELRERATSLRWELNSPVDLDALLAATIRHLHEHVPREGLSPDLVAEAGRLLHGLGEPARATLPDGTIIQGRLLGLDGEGLAVIQTESAPLTLPAASVLMGL